MRRWSLDKHVGQLFEAHHGKFVRFTDHAAEVVRLEARIAALTEEISLDNVRIAGLEGVLRVIPACQMHGDLCIPHAIEWAEARK